MLKNQLTASYPYIRAKNSPNGCKSIFRKFVKGLNIVAYFVHLASDRPLRPLIFRGHE